MTERLLSVRGLRTHLGEYRDPVRAVDGVSFEIHSGEIYALLGESGCGKSMTALSLLRLLPASGRIVGGEVVFQGRDLLRLPEVELRGVRGAGIAMVFQEPMTSLNPVMTVGDQIAEALETHAQAGGGDRRGRVIELLEAVRIPDAERRMEEYPHQLSGGMKQRIVIAIALAGNPDLLIADEPTTALDVTIQAQVLDLLRTLQREPRPRCGRRDRRPCRRHVCRSDRRAGCTRGFLRGAAPSLQPQAFRFPSGHGQASRRSPGDPGARAFAARRVRGMSVRAAM